MYMTTKDLNSYKNSVNEVHLRKLISKGRVFYSLFLRFENNNNNGCEKDKVKLSHDIYPKICGRFIKNCLNPGTILSTDGMAEKEFSLGVFQA